MTGMAGRCREGLMSQQLEVFRWNLWELFVGDVFRGQGHRKSFACTMKLQLVASSGVKGCTVAFLILQLGYHLMLSDVISLHIYAHSLKRKVPMTEDSPNIHSVEAPIQPLCTRTPYAIYIHLSFFMSAFFLSRLCQHLQVSRQAGETLEIVVPSDLGPGDPFQVRGG